MSLVVDASVVLAWYFADERTPATDALLDQVTELGAVAASHWRLEIANGFLVAIRRGRINMAYRDKALLELARLPISVDPDADTYAWTSALHLADRFRLTAYDAAYLELAQRRSLPLATIDKQLHSAADAAGVVVLGGAD